MNNKKISENLRKIFLFPEKRDLEPLIGILYYSNEKAKLYYFGISDQNKMTHGKPTKKAELSVRRVNWFIKLSFSKHLGSQWAIEYEVILSGQSVKLLYKIYKFYIKFGWNFNSILELLANQNWLNRRTTSSWLAWLSSRQCLREKIKLNHFE